MSNEGDFHKLLESGDSLGVTRMAAEHLRNGGENALALNAILYSPQQGDPEARIQQEKARLLELLAEAAESERAALLYNLGCIALYNDDILAAKLRFREAGRLRPGHYPSIHNLAHAHELMADFDDARSELERAHNANPGSALTRINMATICFISGEAEQGLEILRELAQQDPANMGVTLHLCRGLVEHGGPEGAEEARALLDTRPGWERHPQLKACRAYACYLADAWDEGEALFREMVETDPEDEFARLGLIKTLAAQEKFDQLPEQLELYKALNPLQSVDHVIEKVRGT